MEQAGSSQQPQLAWLEGHWGTPGSDQHPQCLGQALCSVHQQFTPSIKSLGSQSQKHNAWCPYKLTRHRCLWESCPHMSIVTPKDQGTGLRHLRGGWGHCIPASWHRRGDGEVISGSCVWGMYFCIVTCPLLDLGTLPPCARGRNSKDLLSQCLGDTGPCPAVEGAAVRQKCPVGARSAGTQGRVRVEWGQTGQPSLQSG